MSTRSMIARAKENDMYESIYCHSDGYYEHNGKLLFEYYQTDDKIDELFALGDLSILGANIGREINFDDHEARRNGQQCRAYHRDRNESWDVTQPVIHSSKMRMEQFFRESWAEYFYLWEDGIWKAVHGRNEYPWVPLRDALLAEGIVV